MLDNRININNDLDMNNDGLINSVVQSSAGYLDGSELSAEIECAMRKIDRVDYLPVVSKHEAYLNVALPIGYEQTCSQPSMVAFILDKLNIVNGNRILEIGGGCGYAAAIASLLCGDSGHVYSAEIIRELADMLFQNTRSLNNITVLCGDGSSGFPDYAPFDRIFLSAGVDTNSFNPDILIKQLNDEGILIYPEKTGSIFKITKCTDEILRESFYGVCFVPLVGSNS